jgi:TM2 domain-containing membrane protein YozV
VLYFRKNKGRDSPILKIGISWVVHFKINFSVYMETRSRTTAALLALFGGVFGMHFFYLGRTGLGIMSVIFTFSGGLAPVAAIIGFINFLILLGMSDKEFDKRYNREKWRDTKRREQEGYAPPAPEVPRRNEEARRRMNPTPQFEQAKTTMSSPSKEALKENGLKKYKDFDYESAIEDFGKALAIDNKDMAVHWNLACLYSLCEQKELAFYHLQNTVELGFKDYEKIKTHDALAYLRVQPEFEAFARAGFKLPESMEHSDILLQLKSLSEQRAQGILTEKEFAEMSRRLYE